MVSVIAMLQDRYKILKAYDGKRGLMLAQKHLPDLILLDMSLPEMDGIDVARELKIKSNTMHIPVISVSARAMEEDIESFLEAGCNDYITKPIDAEELIGKMDKLLYD